VKQAVLERREEILRYQVQVLEREALTAKTPETIKAVNDARDVLLGIIKQKSASEKLMLGSLQQLWEAEGSAFTFRGIDTDTVLLWPVSPRLGISAHFDDNGYEKLFGFAHHAIDIPAEQGTLIQAPADATVAQVSMNGLGYSYVVLQHANGVQTVYGHVSESLVEEGDTVIAGEDFAKTGGRPGSAGAGSYTTGPHLHLAVKIKGVLVDPIKYLPKI
jgi:murein DD-endopeptidase MepM/ murein hydrolase activator NlpD